MSIAPHFEVSRVMEPANIRLGSTPLIGNALLGLGVLLTGLAAIVALGGDAKTASLSIHGLHTGVLISLSFSVGAIGFILANNVANSGWWSLLRKPFEHMAALAWLGGLLFLFVFILQAILVNTNEPTNKAAGEYAPYLWQWMDAEYRTGDVIYEHKAIYLNLPFFLVRTTGYFFVFIGAGLFLKNMSKAQDVDGDRFRTLNAARISAGLLPFYGFAVAFASFDWVMSLDYHWFSTMYGVYYFAGSVMAAITLGTLTFIVLSSVGKMRGAFTVELQHDLAKWMFGMVCFWGYITFSQYFLIWYSQIPEETTWYMHRKENWTELSTLLVVGHFLVPFPLMLLRALRRSALGYGLIAGWLLFMHVIDMYWIIRPSLGITPDESRVGGMQGAWVDIAGIGGVIALYTGLLLWRLTKAPLVNRMEPRMPEALKHKNYV